MRTNCILKLSKLIDIFFLLLLCMVIFIAGCVIQTKNVTDSTYYFALQPKEIKSEISYLENALKSENSSLTEPASFFYLALLYSHFKNPEPDYKRALKNLEKYIALNPEDPDQKSFVKYLHSLLKKVIKNKSLWNEIIHFNKTLTQENKVLNEKYERLVIENKYLKEIIEKLKQIDIQLEKKRKIS